jgi:flagellar FliL protein
MTENQTATARASGAKSLIGMVIAAAFLGSLVAAECLIAWLMIPSVDEVVAQAETRIQQKAPASNDPVDGLAPDEEHAATVEVDLGSHSFSSYLPSRGVNLRVDFHMYGIVRGKEHAEFESRFQPISNRFRESVLLVIRNAEVADLTEANLGLIKRRILEKSNRLMGKALLRDVVITDFTFVEQ